MCQMRCCVVFFLGYVKVYRGLHQTLFPNLSDQKCQLRVPQSHSKKDNFPHCPWVTKPCFVHISGLRSSNLLATDSLQLLVTRLDMYQHLLGTWNTWWGLMTSDLRATGVRRGNRGDNSTVVCSQGKVIQWWTDVSSVSSNANGSELLISIIEDLQPSIPERSLSDTMTKANYSDSRGCPAMSDNGNVVFWN